MTFDLHAATEGFAQDLQDTLDAVLPAASGMPQEHRRLQVLQSDNHRVVRPGTREKPAAIPLVSNGSHVADLKFRFYCYPDSEQQYLAVRRSEFGLLRTGQRLPLFRLDFDETARSVPACHWNVHGESGALSALLALSNPSHDGRLSKVHVPVGGIRHRPCLEDFIEMLLCEFKFDRNPGWRTALRKGRTSWRTFQTKAIVRDMPEAAATVLRKLGYQVTPPDPVPNGNTDMLQVR